MNIRVRAPGRVNLIGEHTDYTGGLALPMAIDLGTTVDVERGGSLVRLRSDIQADEVVVPLDDPSSVTSGWGRYVAGVVSELSPSEGATGTVHSDLPIGAGLSSSASLQVAVALALGFEGSPTELALLCQRAEHRSSGVPCGVMDQMAITHGADGCAVLLDFRDLTVELVAIPGDVQMVVVPSGQQRELAASAYGIRRRECEAVEAVIGPFRSASLADVARIGDPVLARRARHVISENRRVIDFVEAMRFGDVEAAGAILSAGHDSLSADFEVSTPGVDATVAAVAAADGVHGARMVGGGFGGVVVALCDPDVDPSSIGGFPVRPSPGPRRAQEDGGQ